MKIVSSFTYEDVPEGTRVRLLFTWGKSRRELEESTGLSDLLADLVGRGQTTLRRVLVEEMARRARLAAEAPPEPATPGSMDRELLEPVGL
jgi:hypothetical protein